MIRRVALVVALAIACVPITSFALGLGPITMRSALNQPLLAEIDIHSAQPGDLDGLAVRLASKDDFQRVKVDRISFLNKLHFSIAKHKDGSPYIKLTTDEPVTEPYLDFLIEARWARGRALKEYTVLVDPPVLTAETPAPVEQASTTPVFSQPQPQTRQPVRSAPAPRVQEAPRQTRRPLPAPTPTRIPAPTRQMAESGNGSYTVQRNDTLSAIAQRLRPDSVSLNQMMLALLKANPRAFYNNNINRLKAGYVLRTESAADNAANLTRADATREVRRQNLAWREGTTGRLVQQTEMAEADNAGAAEESGSGSDVVADAQDETARLKLVAPGKDGAGTGSTGKDSSKVKKLRQDLILATEALDANKAETDELKTRLAELEDQLTNMQRLINLKDEEMQRLQSSLKEQQSKPEESVAAAQDQKKPEAAGKPKKAVPPKPAKEEQSFIASLLSSDYTMIGVAAVLVLAVVAWLVVRRRKMQEGFQESILNVGMADSVGAASSQMLQPNSESNMVSDFSMSGMDSMAQDSADVDPISEADVYLAYGRHQQADDISRQALARSPDRVELRAKLLEVLHAAKNRAGFEEEAQQLHQQLGGDESNEIWNKVVALGSQIAPDSPMFGGSGDSFSVGGGDTQLAGDVGNVTADEEDLLDFDFDENDSFDMDDTTRVAASQDDDDLDFDVSALDFDLEDNTSKSAMADAGSASDDNVLDFDMGGDEDLDITQSSVMEAAPEEEQLLSLDDDEGDSFDLSLEPEASEEDDGIQFVGGGNELSLEDTGDELSLDDYSAEDEDALDLELDLDESPSSAGIGAADNVITLDTGMDDDEGLGEDIFADVDEIGTKLDLAKAYVDMGDSDGARSILDEVLEEGDDTQKQQAEQLLQQMG